MNTFLAPFQCMYAMVDRIIPACKYSDVDMHKQLELSLMTFIPSIDEIEFFFLHIYTIHLKHKSSQFAGPKTTQVSFLCSFMLFMKTI